MPKTYHGRFHLDSWTNLTDFFDLKTDSLDYYFVFDFFKPFLHYQNNPPHGTIRLIKSISFKVNSYSSPRSYAVTVHLDNNSSETFILGDGGFEELTSVPELIDLTSESPAPFDWYGSISDWGDRPDDMYRLLTETDTIVHTPFIFPNENVIFCYTLNSDKHTVDKSLTPIRTYKGNFNQPVTLRDFILPIDLSDESFMIDFNYVFINQLNRYYYVKETSYMKNFVNLMLHEDVLYTFRDLIREQTAFVERNENDNSDWIVDNYVTTDYNKMITSEIITLTNDIYDSTNTDALGGGYYVMTTVG